MTPSLLTRFLPRHRLAALLLASLAAAPIASTAQGTAPATPALATVASTQPVPVEAVNTRLQNATVKVFSTVRAPDLFKPWSKGAPQNVTGSGVVIEGHRILTNAHVVAYASQVEIQANQAGDKVGATVVAIDRGMDLAVLKLDDERFFDSHPAVARSNALPVERDAVFAYGYPTGGTSLSITKGIVSRIEFVPYHLSVSGLRIQIDAAINPGNSGGPVAVGDQMIGLAFATATNAQNVGYIIPNEEIELFLRAAAAGPYLGKPTLLDDVQPLENPAMRAYLKLPASVTGAVVQAPYQHTPDYPLKQWDVITRIGDAPVDNQGMVKLGDVRVRFQYRVQQVARDGHVALTVLRDGKTLTVSVPVLPRRPLLIPDLDGTYPSYFIDGPLVFSRASAQFMEVVGRVPLSINLLSLVGNPLVTQRGDPPSAARTELVIISAPFFPHALVKGYHNRFASVIYSINGTPVRNLAHLVTLLRDSQDEMLEIRFDQRDGETIVLPRKALQASTDDILADNGIRALASPDLLGIWNGKAGTAN